VNPDDDDDGRWERPDECPNCGGDVVETAAGAACRRCGDRIALLDTRNHSDDDGDDDDGGGG
jgi:hypothetical protein